MNAIHEVLSPLPGTFYLKPAPDAEPFITLGQHIEAGCTVGLVEVMKMYEEIATDMAGIVTEICLDNESAVEPGQVLIRLETNT